MGGEYVVKSLQKGFPRGAEISTISKSQLSCYTRNLKFKQIVCFHFFIFWTVAFLNHKNTCMLFPYAQMHVRGAQFWQRTHKKIKRVPSPVSGTAKKADGSPKDSWIQNRREIAALEELTRSNFLQYDIGTKAVSSDQFWFLNETITDLVRSSLQ